MFWDVSLEEIGQSLKLFSRVSFFVEATDQSLSHASSGLFYPLMKTVNQGFIRQRPFLARKSKNDKQYLCWGV